MCCLLTVIAGCGVRDGLPGAPQRAVDMLGDVPATALERGLFWTDLQRVEHGFGSALPLAQIRELFDLGSLDAVLESGAPPVTVLRGAISRNAVAEAASQAGFTTRMVGPWALLAPSGAPQAGVVAAAVRNGTLLVGSPAEVQSLTSGGPTAAEVDWVGRVLRAAGGDLPQLAFGPPPDLSHGQARRGGVSVRMLLAQARIGVSLPAYEGFVISGPGGPEGPGVFAVAYRPGGADPDVASALAVRVATAGTVGEPARRIADRLRIGDARWHERAGVARVEVDWEQFDPAQLRRDLERSALALLVPGDPG